MMGQKKILVVGGAGFIGSYVNKLLNDCGYQTIVLDNLSHGKKEMVCRGIFIEGDIGSRSDLDKAFTEHKIDGVMHFAALIDVGESIHAPALYYRNNVTNTLNLIESMLRHGVSKFVFSSSAAVYGLPQQNKIDEKHPCLPINPYGETKLIVEKMLADFDRAYHLKSSCLRYFNAGGGDPEKEIKNYKPKESNLIPRVLRTLKDREEPVIIYGTDYPTPDGTAIRDYIHIHDLATAHISTMEQLLKEGPSTIYNLGTGVGHSVREVLIAIEEVVGYPIHPIEGPRRMGDPPILLACADKAYKELHWKPRYSLKELISHAWQAMN